ncbi:MAG: ion transporter [bacterium]
MAQAVGGALMMLIGLNVAAAVIGTVGSVYRMAPVAFDRFEVVSVAIFSAEYLVRIWSCVEDPRWSSPVAGRIRFALSPMALLDLTAILPFYLAALPLDARFVRVFRLLRTFRLARLGRYSRAMQHMAAAFRRQREQLVLTFAVLFVLLILAASLMYHAESEAQPEVFTSIPASMWWAVMTLTTVGYGDTYPVTDLGKLVASVIAVLGIGFFALPAGILGAGLIEEGIAARRKQASCPHCGGILPGAPDPES